MKLDISGPDGKRTFTSRVGTSMVSVGRSMSCDIVLAKDEGVSDLHARFGQFMKHWSVTDQFSDNGTFVNGESVTSQDLKAGDVLKVGNTTIRVISFDDDHAHPAADPGRFHEAAPRAAYQSPPPAPTASSAPAMQPGYGRPPQLYSSPTPQQYAAHQQPYPSTTEQHAKPAAAPPPWESRPAPQQSHRRQLQVLPSMKPKGKNNAMGCVIVGIVIVVVVVIVVLGEIDDAKPKSHNNRPANSSSGKSGKSPISPFERPVAPESPEKPKKDWEYPEQTRVVKEIRELQNDSTLTVLERLQKLDDLPEKWPNPVPNYVSSSLNLARTTLQSKLDVELNARYMRDWTEISNGMQKNDYVAASNLLEALVKLFETTPWHKQAAKNLGFDSYAERMTGDIAKRNAEFVGARLDRIDQCMAAGCYALAVKEYDQLPGAILGVNTRAALELERAAAAEKAGVEPGPDKLPRAKRPTVASPPKNELLPRGSSSQYKLINDLRETLQQFHKDGKVADLACRYRERDAKLAGFEYSRLKLEVSRPVVDARGRKLDFSYQLTAEWRELPPQTMLALYEQMPEPDATRWLAIMMFCYEAGLNDDAARAALKFSRLDPDHRAELEAIMAAKLGIEKPEAGFIERDGMLVPG